MWQPGYQKITSKLANLTFPNTPPASSKLAILRQSTILISKWRCQWLGSTNIQKYLRKPHPMKKRLESKLQWSLQTTKAWQTQMSSGKSRSSVKSRLVQPLRPPKPARSNEQTDLGAERSLKNASKARPATFLVVGKLLLRKPSTNTSLIPNAPVKHPISKFVKFTSQLLTQSAVRPNVSGWQIWSVNHRHNNEVWTSITEAPNPPGKPRNPQKQNWTQLVPREDSFQKTWLENNFLSQNQPKDTALLNWMSLVIPWLMKPLKMKALKFLKRLSHTSKASTTRHQRN